jgi:RND family efflux transporter MFP subunit
MQAKTKRTLVYSGILIVVAIVGFKLLTMSKSSAHRHQPEQKARNVEVQSLEYGSQSVEIFALGRVRSAAELDLAAQVGGKLLWTAGTHGIRPGLKLKAGTLLAVIDTADISLEISSLESQLNLALIQHTLALESLQLANRDVDRLKQLVESGHAGDQALETARKQQIAAQEREASLLHQCQDGGQLRSALGKANLQRERCLVRAPFDLEILSGNWNPGALVNPGTPLAHILELHRLEVSLKIPAASASFLKEGMKGLEVDLLSPETGDYLGAARIEYLSASINPTQQTRDALLTVIDAEAELLPGMLVEAKLQGVPLANTFSLPRRSLREDGRLLLYKDGKLAFGTADLRFTGDDYVLLANGPAPGDSLVVSPIQVPVEGMPLSLSGVSK